MSKCISRYLVAMAAADVIVVVIEDIFYQIVHVYTYNWLDKCYMRRNHHAIIPSAIRYARHHFDSSKDGERPYHTFRCPGSRLQSQKNLITDGAGPEWQCTRKFGSETGVCGSEGFRDWRMDQTVRDWVHCH
ncbi:uncharacterized protein [Narcine bancroftii]